MDADLINAGKGHLNEHLFSHLFDKIISFIKKSQICVDLANKEKERPPRAGVASMHLTFLSSLPIVGFLGSGQGSAWPP